MDLSTWALLVVGGFVLFLWSIRARHLPQVVSFPPFRPFFGMYFELRKNMNRLPQWKLECARQAVKAGSTMNQRTMFGTGVTFIEVLTPALVEQLLNSDFKSYEKGWRFRELFSEVLGTGIFVVDGAAWSDKRKVASHLFSTNRLRSQMEKVFIAHSEDFCALLDKLSKEDHPEGIDLQALFFKFTMDCISEIAFSKSLNSLHKTVPFADAFDAAQEHVVRRFFYPLRSWRILRALNLGEESKMRKNAKIIDDFVYGLIAERAAKDKAEARERKLSVDVEAEEKAARPADLVTLFMESARKNKQEEMTPLQLRDLIMSFYIAGRDTTACALTWMFWLLGQHPAVEAKLRAEIEEVIGEDEPTLDKVKDLQYADAVFSETLRLYPSVPNDSKIACRDTVLGGVKIPAGTVIGYAPYTLGRLESIWGPDAESFRPERWLEFAAESGKQVRNSVSQFQFVQFNAGPRICLGKDLAYFEAKVLTCHLLRRFNIRALPGFKPDFRMTVVLPMKHGLPVTVKPL